MIDLAAGSVMALAGILAVACYKATGSLLISMLAGIVTEQQPGPWPPLGPLLRTLPVCAAT